MTSSNRKKYFIVDNVIIGANHVIGNAGYINYIQNLHPGNCDVHFFAEASHMNNVKEKVQHIAGNNIIYEPINVPKPQSGIINKLLSWQKKLAIDKSTVQQILKRARQEHVEFLLFCTILPSNLSRFQSLFQQYSDLKIGITLHGEIEYLFKQNLGFFDQLKANAYKKAFKHTLENVRYILISKLIREKLIENKVLPAEKLVYIEHPINVNTRQTKHIPEKPILAQVGVASLRKGSEKIFHLAEKFKHDINNNNIEFQVIGKLYDDVKSYDNGLINVLANNNHHISQLDYENYINNATFALNMVTGDDYIFRLSGSLIDSIQYQLPLIALKHDFVSYMFKEGGDIGYMCDSVAEMEQVIQDIIDKKQYVLDRYPQQVENLKQFAYAFYDENIVALFRNNMRETGWHF